MKRNIKDYLKFGILFFGMSLLWNCEQEETLLETQNEQQKNMFVPKAMNIEEAAKNADFTKLSSKFKLTSLLNNQARNSSDFSLDLERFYEINYSNYISYTFLITRDTSTEEVIENLVIEQKNDSIRGYIIKYEDIDYYAESLNVFLRAKVSKTAYQGDLNELINTSTLQFRTTSEWDCELITTAYLRYCSEHYYYNNNNSTCNNYQQGDWGYNTEEICTYTGSGTGPDTTLDQGGSGSGGGSTSDGATTPIIPCRESVYGLGLVGSNSDGNCF
ncbi:MAG: hypothetical protein JKY02_07640, partial [Flavobacteriaceae bacterium]|nr:hypothetical protein [Flavobacteriaceae bacterium]